MATRFFRGILSLVVAAFVVVAVFGLWVSVTDRKTPIWLLAVLLGVAAVSLVLTPLATRERSVAERRSPPLHLRANADLTRGDLADSIRWRRWVRSFPVDVRVGFRVTRLLGRETLRHPWTSEASMTHKLWSLPIVLFVFAAAALGGMVSRLEFDLGALVATSVCLAAGLVGSAVLGVLYRRGWFDEIDRP